MRYVVLIFLFCTYSLKSQFLPKELEKEVVALEFDEAEKAFSFASLEYLDFDFNQINSIRYKADTYNEDRLYVETENFITKDYKAYKSVYYETDTSRLYADGSCNCQIEIDTIFVKNSKVNAYDTVWVDKVRVKTITDSEGGIFESFAYDKKNRLRRYDRGNSYTIFDYPGADLEYRYFRADTSVVFHAELEETGVPNESLISWSIHPNVAEWIMKTKTGKVKERLMIEDFLEMEILLIHEQYEYDSRERPLKNISVQYSIDRNTLDEAQIDWDKIYKRLDKMDDLIAFAEKKNISESTFKYKNGKYSELERLDYYMEKTEEGFGYVTYDDEDPVKQFKYVMLYEDKKRVINFYYNNQLDSVKEFYYNELDDVIETKEFRYIEGVKKRVSEERLDIEYK